MDTNSIIEQLEVMTVERDQARAEWASAVQQVVQLKAENEELHSDWIEALADYEATKAYAETWKALAKQYRWLLIDHKGIAAGELPRLRTYFFGRSTSTPTPPPASANEA